MSYHRRPGGPSRGWELTLWLTQIVLIVVALAVGYGAC